MTSRNERDAHAAMVEHAESRPHGPPGCPGSNRRASAQATRGLAVVVVTVWSAIAGIAALAWWVMG